MRSFPSDSMAQHSRFIEALCQDWREAGTVTRVTPRADAVLEISRQINRDGSEPNKPLPSNS